MQLWINWRPYTAGLTLTGYNTFIAPVGGTSSALYNGGFGGQSGLLPAVMANNYYTFNVTNNGATTNNNMSVLETIYNPATISSVTQSPATVGGTVSPTITVVMSAAPGAGENVYVRYSTDNFVTSTLVQLSFVGATGTASIPAQAAGATVQYYVYSSPKSSAQIGTDVTTYGQTAHDMATLNLRNNAGVNFSYTVLPVTVNATNAPNDASYATLKAAFDAINSGTHTGAINVWISGNTTETLSAVLNASGGPSSYGSVTVRPSGLSRTVSGNLAAPLIDLNGADNVTIDGLNDGSNTLTISNSNSGNAAGTSTIRMYNTASTNTVQNCTIEGSTTNTASGIIFFSTGTNATISIASNTIKPTGANLPVYSVYANGTSNTAITISSNNIQDYFNATVNSAGVFASTGSDVWTVSNNKFFQGASRTVTTAGVIVRAIQIADGGGHTISSNTIGYGNSGGTGTTTYITSQTDNRVIAIELAGTATASSIQGNSVSSISLTSASNLTTAPGIFSGIYVSAGAANIGTVTGNTIGAATGTGSIIITCSNTSTFLFITGIYATSTNTVSIQHNNIGAITLTPASAAVQYNFNAVYVPGATGSFNISDNAIGSTATANSISIGATSTAGTSFTGISCSATGTATFSGNNIQNCTVSGTGGSNLTGIIINGATGALPVTNNNIISCSNAGTGSFTAINNTASATSLNVSGNIFRNNTISSTTGNFTGITNSGNVTSSVTINNNQFGNASGGLITFSAANSTNLVAVNNTGGGAAATLTIQSNDFRGITHTVQGTGNHTYIFNSAATLSQNISTNTFTALNVNTTGGVTFISNSVSLGATGAKTINDNQVIGSFTKTGASAVVSYFYNDAGSSVAGAIITNDGNNFSNITITNPVSGWFSMDGSGTAPIKNITNNTFNNITGNGSNAMLIMQVNNGTGNISNNTISNCNNNHNITGLTVTNGSFNIFSNNVNTFSASTSATTGVIGISIANGTTQNVYKNTVHTLSSSVAATIVRGISVSFGTTLTVYKNKIYNITNTFNPLVSGGAYGLSISGGTTITASNNFIGDVTAPSANFDDAVRGISVSGGTNVNLYYNTVYINAVGAGVNFGSSAVYAATGPILDMRNNIIYNVSTPGASGRTIAYRRNGTLLTTYANSSDNNLFYAGTPVSTTRAIFYDGTNTDPGLAAYQTRVAMSRDTTSVSASLVANFVSIVGSNISYLHLNGTTAAESGAETIAGFTDDYDDEVRFGNPGYTGTGTRADIGADEFESVVCPTTPTISPITGGPYYAGDPITITGTNLLNITYATINDINVTIGATTATTAVLTIPVTLADSVGVVQVAFSSSCPFSATANFIFSGYITLGTSLTDNWSNPAIWRNSALPVANAPATINNNDNVTLDVSIVPKDPIKFTINPGATFTHAINSNVFGTTYLNNTIVWGTLIIDNGSTLTSTNRFISPTLVINSGGTFTNNCAVAAAVNVTNFYVWNGGTYTHNATTINTATNVAGVVSDFPGGSGTRTFGASSNVTITRWATSVSNNPINLPPSTGLGWGNLTINVPTFAGSWNQLSSLTNIQGNLTIIATGGTTREFRLAGSAPNTTTVTGNIIVSGGILANTAVAFSSTLNVTGNVTINGGTFTGTSGSAGTSNIIVTGNLTLSSGALNGITSGSSGVTSSLTVNGASGITISGGTYTPTGGASQTFITTVANALTLSGGNITSPGSSQTHIYSAASLAVSSGTFGMSASTNTNLTITTTGNITISGTGSLASSNTGAITINCGNDFVQSSSSATAFRFQTAAGNAGVDHRLIIGGNFNMTNGTFTGGGSSSIDSIIFKGGIAAATYTQSGGTMHVGGGPNVKNHFAVYPGKTLTLNNSIIPASSSSSNGWSVTVYNGATLDCGTNSIGLATNPYTVVRVNSGATLRTAHAGGVFNSVSNSAASIVTTAANAILDAGATYVFNGSVAQITSVFATTPVATPSNVANMVINNSNAAGVTLSQSFNVSAALQMQTGNLTLTTFNLTTASITGAPFSNTKMVITNSTGYLGQPVALATILYPVGNSGNYTPASYTFTVNSTPRYLNVRAVTPRNSNDLSTTNYINNRWWNTDLSVTTGSYTYTSSYTFMPADVVGAAASIRLNRWNGSAWIADAGSSITGNVLNSSAGLTQATGTLSATAEWVGRVFVAPAIYHWINPAGGSWLTSANWSPIGVPGSGDGVIFDVAGGATYTTTSVPTGISLTQFTVSTNNIVTYNAGATGTINMIFPGTATPQFSVASGSSMTISGANAVNFNLPSSATGNVAGSLRLQQTAHTVTVTNANALVFPSGGYFSTGIIPATGFSGNPFGATGTPGAVIFQNGSVCETFEGSNPFGSAGVNICTFQTGSLFRYSDPNGVTAPSISGRTYSNFTWNANKTTSIAAANSFICDSLTVTIGIFNLNLQGTPTPDHSIKGNINVVTGATLTFTPASTGTVNLNSGATQIIWGGGTFNVNALSTFDINAGTTASLQKNMGVNSTGIMAVNGTLICTGENYVNSVVAGGTVNVNNGGTLSMQSINGVSSTVAGNIRTTNFPYINGGNYTYSGNANQITGLRLGSAFVAPSVLTIANTGIAPNNVVTLTNNNTSTPRINLSAGQFNAGTGGTLVISGGTNLVVGTGGNQYLSGTATDNIIRFATNGAVSGTPELWNVTIGTSGTGVDFQSNARINGILLINSGGFVVNNAARYNTGSYLIYNTGGGYNRTIEWGNNSGLGTAGYPHHVTVQNGTTLDFQSPLFDLGCGGNLTLGAATAGTLVLSSYLQPYDLFVKGNISIGGAAAGTLTMSNSVGCDLKLTGNWVRNALGTVNFGGGNGRSVYFEGSTDATITATGGQYFPYLRMQKNVKATKVTLADHVSIGFEATFTTGTLDLGTNNKFFSILSNSLVDGRVDVSDSTNTAFVYGTDDINGQFIVQRYMPARRAWRLVNAPFKRTGGGTHSISQAWQEQGNGANGRSYTSANWAASVAADSSGGVAGGYATQITGGTTVTTGFDLSPNNASSIKFFAGAGTWNTPANTNATGVNSQEGWLLFVRGDRENYGEITNNLKTPTITTLRPRGQIFLGQKTITASGMQTVGNPYASAVDYFAMSRTGSGWPANPTYYVWDPSLGGSAGVGAFVTLQWNGTNFTRISTGYGTGNYDNRYIPSGAAIMVDFPAGGGTLSMNEINKNTDSNTTAFRPVRQLTTLLQAKEADDVAYVIDGTINLFGNDFNNDADKDDARKLSNVNETFCLRRKEGYLSIERKKLDADADTIFYYMSRMQRKDYQLKFVMDGLGLPSSTTAFLEDTYLKKKTPVSITDTTVVDFSITTDAASAANERFRLVFRRSVKYTKIDASILNDDVAVSWIVSNEWSIEKYEIERSSNGTSFTAIAEKLSNGESAAPVYYNGLDLQPAPGEYYYRIKSISKNGAITYSDVAKVKVVKASPALYVFPNPATNGVIQLQMNRSGAGVYSTSLYGNNGQVVNTELISHAGGTATKIIQPKQYLTGGTYQLKVTGPDGKVTVIKVMVVKE
ncbi:MAG: hypothetical protein V4685_15010 [Bacteroidota bacterium]